MNKPSAAHVIAIVLLTASQVLQFLTTNPALAAQMHVTSQIMLVAGALVALASERLFGTATPPAAAPLLPPDPAVEAKSAASPAVKVAAVAASVLAFALFISGCTAAQGQTALNAITPGLQFAQCVVNEYEKLPTGTPLLVVLEDEAEACGGDAQSVIQVLNVHEPAAMHATVAHGSAQ